MHSAVFRDEGMVPALVEGMQMYKLDITGPDAYQPISQEEIQQVSNPHSNLPIYLTD